MTGTQWILFKKRGGASPLFFIPQNLRLMPLVIKTGYLSIRPPCTITVQGIFHAEKVGFEPTCRLNTDKTISSVFHY